MLEPELIGTLTAGPETRQRPEVQSGQGPLGQGTEARAQLGVCSQAQGRPSKPGVRDGRRRQLWKPHV